MINLESFFSALKTSWVRRYVIDKLDDRWADMVDSHLGINMLERDIVLDYGPEKFKKSIQAGLQGISSIFQAYKKVKTLFPTDPDSMDNHGWHRMLCITRISPENNKTKTLWFTYHRVSME